MRDVLGLVGAVLFLRKRTTGRALLERNRTLCEAAQQQPLISTSEWAARFGLSRERVGQILREHGVLGRSSLCLICKTPFQQTRGAPKYCSRTCYRVKERARDRARSRIKDQRRPRDYHRAKEARRRARVRAADHTLTAVQWKAIKRVYGHRCAYCGIRPRILTIEHVIPLISGGAHVAANIVPACQSCNSRKGTGPPLSIPARRLLL